MSKLEASEIKEVAAKAAIDPNAREYVTIPATDLYDHVHPTIQLNRHKFEAGKTYSVSSEVAREIRERISMFSREQVRLLRPNVDSKAQRDVARGSQWSVAGAQPIALDNGLGGIAGPDAKVYTIDF
jgi:hypothetical protein